MTERFYRVDRGRSRDSGGTGLGLAIVKHVLERHQANLNIESKLGVGSTFTATFPARRIDEIEAEAVPLDKKTVRTGYQAGTTQGKVPVGLTQKVFPNLWGPVKGPVQSGSLTKNIEGGTLTIAWQINR